jgi:hypothetical protein
LDNVAENKINIQKPVAFQYANNEQAEKESEKEFHLQYPQKK